MIAFVWPTPRQRTVNTVLGVVILAMAVAPALFLPVLPRELLPGLARVVAVAGPGIGGPPASSIVWLAAALRAAG